jgi:hypothetical protein
VTARDRIVVIVVAVVAAIAGSWLLVISPKRSEASKLGAQITKQQSQLSTARSQVAAGEAARSTYAHDYTDLARLGEAVPADDNVPSLIVQLQHAANQSGVDFRNLVLAASSGSSSGSGTGTNAATLPPGVTIGAANLPVEPFTFTFNGNFFHLANFFGRLQHFVRVTNQHLWVSGRLMTLNGISFAPGPNGFPQITATINATTYLVPATEGLMAGATPSGPATGTTPTTSTSATPAAASPSTGSGSSPVSSAAISTPVR